MNGAQDVGGDQNLGPIPLEAEEPVFHAEWERRVFALALAMGFTGTWTLDASRRVRESLPPAEYLSSSYYEIWLRALELQIVEHGLASVEELDGGLSDASPRPVKRVLKAEAVMPLFDSGFPSDRPAPAAARFSVGDVVVTRNVHPLHHTRLPRYMRGKRGTVERVHGAFVFPDASAHGEAAPPQWLYTVAFEAAELWGESAVAGDCMTFEAFESYLLPTEPGR